MASIFGRMFQYRQSEGRTPSEDYFTELFAGALERCESLGTTIAGHLIGRNDITRVEVRTQTSFHGRGRRVDMYVTAWVKKKRHVLVIESKIDSGEGENQLRDYIDLLAEDEGADSRTLAYITKKSEDPNVQALGDRKPNVEFKHRKWSRVYDWIKEHVERLEGSDLEWKGLLNEILTLMEEWNMGGPISARSMRAAITYHNCLSSGNSLFKIIDDALDESGLRNIINGLRMPNNNWSPNDYQFVWKCSPATKYSGDWICMGFRFDRREQGRVWNVDKLELPSAAVTVVSGYGAGAGIKRPSKKWKKGSGICYENDRWIRQTEQPPRHGKSLEEFYSAFFYEAFQELCQALGGK